MNIEKLLEENASAIDAMIEKYIPRRFSKQSALFRVTIPRYSCNVETINKAVAEPVWEFLDRGGKRWRPTLFLLVIQALGKNPDDFIEFSIIPEVVHNGTLMVDDIEDASDLRRGKPCTYKIYGLDIAINAGNAMYYLPLLPLLAGKHKIEVERLEKIYETYAQEMINLSIGQAMDIAWHRGMASADKIEEDDYLQMCAYKTGTLARMAARMAAILAGADDRIVEALGYFAESIGVAFQMQDDVLDLVGKDFGDKKGGGGQDVTEGKRTLMVIRTLKIAGKRDRERLILLLNMHSEDEENKKEAISIMQKYGSIDYVKDFAKRLVRDSWQETERLLPKTSERETLKAFADFLIERKI